MTPVYQYHTFPCGIRLVHLHTSSPVAYAGIMVGAGTRDEQPQENGLAHYIEHCVFKGSLTLQGGHLSPRSNQQIIHRIEDIGGEINAYTTKEETVFYAATPIAYIQRTLHLLLDLVFRPTFPKTETDKEVGVILDEIESYNDSPSELIYDDFENLLFCGHPLAQPILGTRRSLHHISRSAELPLRFMQRHYRPDRMVLFTQGKIAFERILHILDNLLENNPSAYSYPQPITPHARQPFIPSLQEQHSVAYRKHTHQVHLMLGNRAFPLGHPMQLPLYLLNNIIGGGAMSSRLNMSLREQQGLVYTVESQYTPLSDTGYWCVYLACDPEDKNHCLELVYKELQQFIAQPLTTQQIHHALRQIRGQMAISAENTENNALAMAKHTLYFGEAHSWKQTYQLLQSITPDTLQQVAEQVFNSNQLYLLSYE